MSNALAKIDFDQEQLAVIEAQFFPAGASKAEQQYCFSVAKELGLNPITKEIYFVPRRTKVGERWLNKVEPMVGRDGFLSIAHRSGQLAGIESNCSIKDVPVMDNAGNWSVKPELVAECIVYRKDSKNKYVGQVKYSEYVQKTQDGKPTKFWAEKPDTMLKKVAESQVLRKAFNIHGVYCPEEMGSGFESENGEIITPIEAEFTKIEDKSHLSIVRPPAPEASVSVSPPPPPPVKPVTTPPPPPTTIETYDDDDQWPDIPEPKQAQIQDGAALEIIALLDGKHISYDIIIEGINGIISAQSYNEKELLKSSGFRWSPDLKKWQYKFQNEPF